MFTKILTTTAIAGVLALGTPTGSVAVTGGAQNPVSKVGQATKDVGKATVKGTKEAVKTTGEVTKDTAKKVEGAVTPGKVSATCKDGRVHTGKTKKAACAHHGGIKR